MSGQQTNLPCRTGRGVSSLAAATAALIIASCVDTPTAPDERFGKTKEPQVVAALACEASVATRTVACSPVAPSIGGGGLRNAVLVGGQHTYVSILTDSVVSDSVSFEFNMRLTNLIPQAMGTLDGSTGHVNGVRVFVNAGPTVTSGSGLVEVQADSTATFTAPNQPFYGFSGSHLGTDGILSPNETSGKRRWRLTRASTVQSFSFSLLVSTEVPHPDGYIDVTPGHDTLVAGSTEPLVATVRDYLGNPVGGAVTWGTSNSSVASVNSSGVITGEGPGSVTITATSGARTGTMTLAVCPGFPSVGSTYRLTGVIAGFCLGQGDYTIVASNPDASNAVSMGITGSGIVPFSATPSPDLTPLSGGVSLARAAASNAFTVNGRPLVEDEGFHTRILNASRRIPRPVTNALRPRFAITQGVPAVGALMSLNVSGEACTGASMTTGRVMSVGSHLIVVADTLNPAGGLSSADYDAIAAEFDAVIWPTLTGAIGTPGDTDGNGRVIAYYTRAVNALTPPASSSYVGGFFFARDLFPAASCSTSNVGEMFYMLAADPSGEVNGNVRTTAFVKSVTNKTLAHEFQHLLNASRRMHVNTPWNGHFEEVWMEEGLSHISEELTFYAYSGLAPKSNVSIATLGDPDDQAAYFRYADSNINRLRQWLLSPHSSGPFQADDDLSTRGAIWSFLRYAGDRRGHAAENTFWYALVNTGATGMTNLTAAIGSDPLPWMRDWSGAMYADDAGGSGIDSHPSWNFRSIFSGLDYDPGPACTCAYELAVRNPANGVADNFTLSNGGSAAYVRVGVEAGGYAGVTTLSSGLPANYSLVIVRRK